MAIPAEDPNEPPEARLTDRDARNWAVGAHLAGLVGLVGVPAPLGPLVVWLIKREDHPFVDDQGKEALNFQLSVFIYEIIGIVAAFLFTVVTLGIGLLVIVPLAILFALGVLALTILAAVKASEGERYRYPFTIRLVS